MTRDELRDRQIEARTKSMILAGELIGLEAALVEVLNARDLADARGAIQSRLSMTKIRRASFDIEARNAEDDLRILEARDLDAATKRLDDKMVAAGVISRVPE